LGLFISFLPRPKLVTAGRHVTWALCGIESPVGQYEESAAPEVQPMVCGIMRGVAIAVPSLSLLWSVREAVRVNRKPMSLVLFASLALL